MAKRASTIVGLEIEPSAIHVAAVTVNGRVSVKTAAVAPLETGVVRDGEVNDVAALAEALRSLYRDNKGLDKKVRIGIANQKIVVRVIELPPIADAKELEAAVRFQAQDQIPMPLDSAVLDYQPLDIVETEDGPRQRVLIVAARRDMVDRVTAACRAAGLKPEGIDLSAFAMIRALHRPSHTDEPEPVLYLSVGGLTNLAVAEGTTCLFTRVVGGGLEAIAVELAERKALTLEHARGWLRHVGLVTPVIEVQSDDQDGIAEEARSVLLDGVRRIGGEVRNSLDFHHAQEGMSLRVQRAVLTGAAASVPGFDDALGAELGLAVELGTVDGTPEGMDPHLLTIAAGLAVEEAPHA
ncbi:MAG TPA: type IV pilus assembly protein PilM [Baekduia sp.]|uniref:type IV pilus assembly protein PilM n=1 Tax=Baekduia sp. TaxID=2600305 RepID=UPI002C56ACE4|nr:type IV pilus assembly protein PilM [Baekduia sp.]HMJ32722.1 type IV pilus assembly protein PilM [Baekduia sp.]